jgi:DNA-binding LacI/PurR family transcriptional regulator
MASNIREVAARAKVSTATVTRVFASPDLVTDRTRRRVLAAARELAWTPNQTARSLALGRTGNLGLLNPDVSNPAFGGPVKEAQQFARERGFSLFVACGDGSTEDERAVLHALAAKVDGLILVAPRMSREQLSELQRLVPLVLVNRTAPGIPATIIPTRDGMTSLVEHLASEGYRRLLYLSGPSYSPSNTYRLAAFQEAAGKLGLEPVTLGPFEPEYVSVGRRAIGEILDLEPDAVIGYNDLVAVGVMAELQKRGIRPGSDIGVAGFDGSWLGETTAPSLTSVEVPFNRAIRHAVADVIDLIEGQDAVLVRELPSRLIIRASTTQEPAADQPTETPAPLPGQEAILSA